VLDEIEEIKRRLHYSNGEAIFLQGARTRWFHILCRGRVKLVYRTEAGKRIVIDFRVPGEILNWHAWPEYPFAAESSGKSVVASINRRQVELLIDRYPKLRERIDRELADFGPGLLKRMADIVYDSAEDRLRYCLTYLARRHGVQEGNYVVIDLPLRERDIAEMIACSRQTVSQEIHRLVDTGLIQYAHRRIIVTDVAILKRLR
jgi:CRP/FNR family transcriptional regulator